MVSGPGCRAAFVSIGRTLKVNTSNTPLLLLPLVCLTACPEDQTTDFCEEFVVQGLDLDEDEPVEASFVPATSCAEPEPEPAPTCDALALRTTRSYTGVSSDYELLLSVLRCDDDDGDGEDDRFTLEGMPSTTLQVQTRRLADAPDVAGYVDLDTVAWGPVLSELVNVGVGTTILPRDAELPAGASTVATIVRARPVAPNGAPIGIDWSPWVQVNHGTRYALLEATRYWRMDAPDGSSETAPTALQGTNYARCEDGDFDAQIGWHPPEAFHDSDDLLPTAEATSLMAFTKSNRRGYHQPGYAWEGEDSTKHPCDGMCPVWERGQSNLLFWLDGPHEYPAGQDLEERWLFANGAEWYAWGTQAPPSPWHDEALQFSGDPAYVMGDGTTPVDDDFFGQPSNLDPSLRNYMLAPEYVGQGWGIYVEHGPEDHTWAVQANVHPAEAIPGLSGVTGPVLQLSYFEGVADFLVSEDAQWGHREDWFLHDGDGVLRVEGRATGPLPYASLGSGRRRTRMPVPHDPDIVHREIIQAPHYCMTQVGRGTCSLDRP